MLIRCPNCQTENPEGTRYCRRCNVNLGDAAPKDTQGRPLYTTRHRLSRPARRPTWFLGWRYDLLADVHGRVLELGVRNGPNFRFYQPDTRVVATDVDANTLKGTRRLFARFAQGIALSAADAQRLPFADHSFDAVVSTLVFCSIPDPARALGEIARVLRPGGRLYTIDHVRSDQPVIGAILDALTPTWKIFAGGCHLNRRTADTLRDSGFMIHSQRTALGGVLRMFISEPPRS
ncbi:MAG: methyltransferase domain-containing protein [Anaerolineae bacterium]|nr:methyltransferase domain-containing protein [Anaerolineae bacterium]